MMRLLHVYVTPTVGTLENDKSSFFVHWIRLSGIIISLISIISGDRIVFHSLCRVCATRVFLAEHTVHFTSTPILLCFHSTM